MPEIPTNPAFAGVVKSETVSSGVVNSSIVNLPGVIIGEAGAAVTSFISAPGGATVSLEDYVSKIVSTEQVISGPLKANSFVKSGGTSSEL